MNNESGKKEAPAQPPGTLWAWRAVIVDDEALARALLLEYLATHPEIEIVAECANGYEAVKAVNELAPDLLLLDIQMPKLDGFEVLELVDRDIARKMAVVFITAYDEHALRAFEVHAADYLLKPYSAERLDQALVQALDRVRARAGARVAAVPPAPETSASDLPVREPAPGATAAAVLSASARAPGQYSGRIVIRDGSKVAVVPVDQLDYIEAQDDYIAIHANGKTHMKQQTISEVECSLDPARFVRIHRSYILRFERLSKIEPYAKDSRVAILTDGTRLPVSRAGYARLKELLDS